MKTAVCPIGEHDLEVMALGREQYRDRFGDLKGSAEQVDAKAGRFGRVEFVVHRPDSAAATSRCPPWSVTAAFI